MRIQSEKPAKNGGYFHRLDADYQPPTKLPPPPPEINAGALMTAWRRNTSSEKLEECATALGVTLESLQFLEGAYAPEYNAFAFPMRNGKGEVCGIRLRGSNGTKLSVKGSKAGVFFPVGAMLSILVNRVYVCEGVTDAAAALSCGIFGIGRPSCVGQEDILIELLKQIGPREVVIVCDNDERETATGPRRPGYDGAMKLSALMPFDHLLFVPPQKDFRAMCQAGAGKLVIESLISNLLWNKGKRNSF